VDLRAVRDRLENEPPGFLRGVGDLGLKATAGERGGGPFEVGAIGRALELGVGRSWIRESDTRAAGS
jgi:hypothetical protein